MKKCANQNCPIPQEQQEFWKNQSQPDGLERYCVPCLKANRKPVYARYRKRHKYKLLEQWREMYHTKPGFKEYNQERVREWRRKRKELGLETTPKPHKPKPENPLVNEYQQIRKEVTERTGL